MNEAQAEASAAMAGFMDRLASVLRGSFPFHSSALRVAVEFGSRLTADRWHRVARVLASLHAVPGPLLTGEEHRARNLALDAIVVAQKMAAAGFGGRDPVGCRDFAVWLASEIEGRMSQLTSADEGRDDA